MSGAMHTSQSQSQLAGYAATTTPRRMRRTPSEPIWRGPDSPYGQHAQVSPSASTSSSSGTPSPTQTMSASRARQLSHTRAHSCAPAAPEKIYVLSADGSQLFLIDPSQPLEHEEPPPYATVMSPPQRQRPGLRPTGSDPGVDSRAEGDDAREADAEDVPLDQRLDGQNALGVTFEQVGDVGVSARTTPRRHRLTGASVPTLGSAVLAPPPPSPAGVIYPAEQVDAAGPSRHRASTLSSLQSRAADLARVHASVTVNTSPSRPAHRTRHHSSANIARGVATGADAHPPTSPAHLRRNLSRATLHTATPSAALRRAMSADERTPLLYRSVSAVPAIVAVADESPSGDPVAGRGLMRSIFCGDLDPGEITHQSAGKAWRRYWRPLGRKVYWRGLVHLLIFNFPLALLVWPFLLVGTLAGTALLITLPLGVAVWWLTLIIARSAAKIEMILQTKYHAPLAHTVPDPVFHPIFHYLRPVVPSQPASAVFGADNASVCRLPNASAPSSPLAARPGSPSPFILLPAAEEAINIPELVWEKRFVKCSYAMFLDHYSYSALSYFLLIKPVVTLFSFIALLALFPVCLVLVLPLPVYLRAARRWGRWQATVAIENL